MFKDHKEWLRSRSNKIVSAAGILKRDDGKILLVKPSYKDEWLLPGGGVDAGEHPKEACVREFFEETNLSVVIEEVLLVSSKLFEYDGEKFESFNFLFAVNCGDFDRLLLDGEEIVDFKWVTLSEAQDLMSGSWRKRLDFLGKGIYLEIE